MIPPVPWTAPQGGGFHFRDGIDHPAIPRALKPLPLVRRASKKQKAMLAKADLSNVYAALNAAQETAWRVQPRVYSTLIRMIEAGVGGPGLTMANPRAIPERPAEAATDSAANVAWRNEARKAHTSNAKASSKRLAEYRVFSAARKFSPYPSIYFAYNLDRRGRMYPCSDDLSPHGNDLQRGLLEFANGDPLTEDGVEWLMIHLANTYGIDKVNFAERKRWAADHVLMILECAARPLECDAWHKADDPWQFLAACFAWQDYHLGGLGTVCRVPVMLDGSCSGIQHYAALLRDEDAGAAVNLVPADKPGDLYANVAANVMERLRESNLHFAQEWLAWGISRKIVKRSVMVLPYGGTFLSCLDYVREAVRDRISMEGQPPWLTEESHNDAFVTLAKVVWAAMHDIVEAPLDGMKYVQRITKAWARVDRLGEVAWIAPSGFPVSMAYPERSGRAGVTSTIDGKPFTIAYYNEGKRPNWRRVEAASPPNFVHSLDASHLVFSLNRASKDGINQVAVVHDAFGTTPSKTGEFVRILREEFSRMYHADQFDCLRTTLRNVGGEVPEGPKSGRLNIADIGRATYLFA